MKKKLKELFEPNPINDLEIVQTMGRSVRLQSSKVVMEITCLSEDLIRLRIARGKRIPEKPSWAVNRTDWPRVNVHAKAAGSLLVIRTFKAALHLNLKNGQWELKDCDGKVALSSVPTETGFSKAGSRLCLKLETEDKIFGLGESSATYNKRGLIRELWNIDVLGHTDAIHPGLRSLYVSIPFGLLLRDGRVGGLFWDYPGRQNWDMGQTRLDVWELTAESNDIDLYLFAGPSVREVVRQFTKLTGRMPLPPRWALGYHQCRYSYLSRREVETVTGQFRKRKIPCDAIYFDVHHMDGFRVFTFGKAFPKPKELIGNLRKDGFKVVAIVDPGVKIDKLFGVYRRGVERDAFVKAPKGEKDFTGKVWPGKAEFPDFLNSRVRRWWGKEQNVLSQKGVAGFWNDMNEPANFNLPTKTLPEDCIHRSDFGLVRHKRVHNVYGMQMARASREGALRFRPKQRPFIITRAGYAGVQRYAMVWTGDNSSAWEHLYDSIQMLLNLSLSGVSFCGSDIGGFLDNTTPELLIRWMQLGAFTPFFRNHTSLGSIPQEPWAFGKGTEDICRRYIELRYRLLPYLYCLFAEARRTGVPIMRPLFWLDQDDPVAAAASDEFLLGNELLVAPVTRQGARARSVYLPKGSWYDYWTARKLKGGRHVLAEAPLEKIPLYVRAGAIIPMTRVAQYIPDRMPNEIDLHVWPGKTGNLDWYEDDGISNNYESGAFLWRNISLKTNGKGGSLTFEKFQGEYTSDAKRFRLFFHTLKPGTKFQTSRKKLKFSFDKQSLVHQLTISNPEDRLEIRWRS